MTKCQHVNCHREAIVHLCEPCSGMGLHDETMFSPSGKVIRCNCCVGHLEPRICHHVECNNAVQGATPWCDDCVSHGSDSFPRWHETGIKLDPPNPVVRCPGCNPDSEDYL